MFFKVELFGQLVQDCCRLPRFFSPLNNIHIHKLCAIERQFSRRFPTLAHRQIHSYHCSTCIQFSHINENQSLIRTGPTTQIVNSYLLSEILLIGIPTTSLPHLFAHQLPTGTQISPLLFNCEWLDYMFGSLQSPTLGAHAHAHGFWVGMGAILLVMLQFLNTWAQFEHHGWACVGIGRC